MFTTLAMPLRRLAGSALGAMLFALIIFPAGMVDAAEVKISGRPLSFEAPDGYCLLRKNDPLESVAINVTRHLIGPSEIVVWIFYDCEEKDRLLSGQGIGISHSGGVLVTKRKAFVEAAEKMSRADYLTALSKAQPWQNLAKEQEQRSKNAGIRAKPAKIKEIGKDEFAVYIAVTQSVYMARRWVTFVGVSAETSIKNLPVSIELTWVDDGKQPLTPLLEEVKSLVRDTIDRNEGNWTEEPSTKKEPRNSPIMPKSAVF